MSKCEKSVKRQVRKAPDSFRIDRVQRHYFNDVTKQTVFLLKYTNFSKLYKQLGQSLVTCPLLVERMEKRTAQVKKVGTLYTHFMN